MKESLYPVKLYLRHLPNLIMLGIGLFLNLAMTIWLFVAIPQGSEAIYLHYTILYGVDLTGSWHSIFSLPLAGLGILCINGVLGWLFFHREKIMAYLLLFVACLCQFFLLLSAGILVFLNA